MRTVALNRAREAQRQRWRADGWYPTVTIGQACADSAAATPDTRLTFASRHHTTTVERGELHRRARRVATGLLRSGVHTGDPVLVQAPSSVPSTVALEALWLTGAVVIPVVPFSSDAEVATLVERSGATTMVAAASSRGADLAAATRLAVPRLITVDDLDDLARSEPMAQLPEVDPSSTACVIYTSGSTAAPKGVRHSHETLLAGHGGPVASTGAVSLMAFPAGHIASVLGLVRPLVAGGTTVVMDRWSPSLALDLIEAHHVTSSAGTPFFLGTLLDEAERRGRDISSIEQFLVGAASVPPALVERAEAAGILTWRTYGSTEHPGISSGLPSDTVEQRTRTDGRPTPGNEVRIVDETGRDAPIGETGEILARGPRQFLGYDDRSLDEEAFTGESWFRTGDIGRLDAEGFLTVTDRIKDIIIRGGENVSASEVEGAIATHPDVAEVAVCAAPDDLWGERVCAFVQPRPGKVLTLADVRDHVLTAGLAEHKAPDLLELVEDLPRTAAGKVRKATLRAPR